MNYPLVAYPTDHYQNALVKVHLTYCQFGDCNSPLKNTDNYLDIWTEDDGYYCLKTDRWTFDNIEELIDVLKDFQSRFVNKVFQENEVENEIQSKTKETCN